MKLRSACLLLSICGSISWTHAAEFDHYKLALSWSPTYCKVEAPQKNRSSSSQCASSQAHRFIVHGLWPQYAEEHKPGFCPTGQAFPSQQLIQEQKPLVPDSGLVIHQWRKHGTCTGMSAPEYFAAMRTARGKVKVPELFQTTTRSIDLSVMDVKTSFMQANPGLSAEMITLTCRGQKLSDVRICMSKSFEFIPCDDDRDMCPKAGIQLLPPQ